jgi:hypothetical protein
MKLAGLTQLAILCGTLIPHMIWTTRLGVLGVVIAKRSLFYQATKFARAMAKARWKEWRRGCEEIGISPIRHEHTMASIKRSLGVMLWREQQVST